MDYNSKKVWALRAKAPGWTIIKKSLGQEGKCPGWAII
jgi:hypothetical protein